MRLTFAAVLALGVAAAPAGATGCPFITDVTGDVGYVAQLSGPAYDLVSADIASDGTTLTVVMRVDDLAPGSGVSHPANYMFIYRQGSALVHLNAYNTATGAAFNVRYTESPATENPMWYGAATGSIDPATDEIRISVALATLPAYASAAPGSVLSGFRPTVVAHPASVALPHPVPPPANAPVDFGLIADDQRSTDTYTAGDPACITP